jgi:hypothetical protein
MKHAARLIPALLRRIRDFFFVNPYANETDDEWADRQW